MMRFAEMAASLALYTTMEKKSRSGGATASFQWCGTISALFLLILNRLGRRSSVHNTLLVLYLFTCFPAVLFKILRGEFGYWIAFLAVASNLFFPEVFPVLQFLLFVITPDWVADGLRDRIVDGVFCVVVAGLLFATQVQGIGGFRNYGCNLHCICYCLGMGFLFLSPMLYLGFTNLNKLNYTLGGHPLPYS